MHAYLRFLGDNAMPFHLGNSGGVICFADWDLSFHRHWRLLSEKDELNIMDQRDILQSKRVAQRHFGSHGTSSAIELIIRIFSMHLNCNRKLASIYDR